MIKKILAVISVAVLSLTAFTACGKEDDNPLKDNEKKPADVEIKNFDAPVDGEEIAVITFKDYGTIRIKLFPDKAPKGVENFKALVNSGYYDELIMHRVEKDFCIQGGDPKGNGTGGNSTWGEDFDIEADEGLLNFTGAVAYAHATDGGNGSQFYIISTKAGEITDDDFKNYESYDMYYPENVKEKYKEVGGAPFLDGGYTVFGQVFDEDMEVVRAINNVEVKDDGSGNITKPAKQVLIEKAEIIKYKG